MEPLLGDESAACTLDGLVPTGKRRVPTDLNTTEFVVSICDVRSKLLQFSNFQVKITIIKFFSNWCLVCHSSTTVLLERSTFA